MATSALNSGYLSGSVTAGHRDPVANARVELRAMNGQVVASDYTEPNGSFALYNIPFGHYEVVVLSGLSEARERVEVRHVQAFVSLNLPVVQGSSAMGNTVSLQQLKVPGKARKEVEKARNLMERDKPEESLEHVNQALKIAPDFAEALTLRAILALRNQRLEEARLDLEKAIQSDPQYPMAYVVLGANYNALQRFDDAQRVLDRAVVMAPNTWQAYFELSKAALGKGEFPVALREANKAQDRVKREFAPLHLVKAYALLGLKHFGEAIWELQSYLKADPKGHDAARAQETLKDLERAHSFGEKGAQ